MALLDSKGETVTTNTQPGSRATVHVAPIRELTPGEMRMLETVFGSSVDFKKVRIHNETYLPHQDVPVTPNGEIYYIAEEYQPDFSDSPLKNPCRRTEVRQKNTFVHEMVHVWQHQHGMNVKKIGMILGICSRFHMCTDPYLYVLDPEAPFSEYGMEQQAQIVSDYYTLKYLSHMDGIAAVMMRDNQEISNDLKGIVGPDSDKKIRERVFREYWLDLYELVIGSTFQ